MVSLTALALDIGGTKVSARAERRTGAVVERAEEARIEWRRDEDRSTDPGRVLRLAHDVLSQVRGPGPLVVGVAFPGTMAADGTVTRWPLRPHWVGFDLVGWLHRGLGPAVVADDGLLAARAEVDARPGATDGGLLYLGLGTGVGGAVSVPGGGLHPLEPGHLLVCPDDPGAPCACGRLGCLQAYVGADALRRRGLRQGRHVAEARAIDVLALALADLAEVHRFNRVVLGGGVAVARPDLPAAVSCAMRRRFRRDTPRPVVEPAHHGHRSSLVGAMTAATNLLGSTT